MSMLYAFAVHSSTVDVSLGCIALYCMACRKRNAPSGNRTRGISMATRYFTTKPTALRKLRNPTPQPQTHTHNTYRKRRRTKHTNQQSTTTSHNHARHTLHHITQTYPSKVIPHQTDNKHIQYLYPLTRQLAPSFNPRTHRYIILLYLQHTIFT